MAPTHPQSEAEAFDLLELERFLESSLFKRLMEVCDRRLSAITSNLASESIASTMERVRYLQGEYSGVMFWKQFPDILYQTLMGEVEVTTEESEDGNESE